MRFLILLLFSTQLYAQKLSYQKADSLLLKDHCDKVIEQLLPDILYLKKKNINLTIQYLRALELCNHNRDALSLSYELLQHPKINSPQKARIYLVNARLYEKIKDTIPAKKSLRNAALLFTRNTPQDIKQMWNIRMSSFYRIMTPKKDSARYYLQEAMRYDKGEIASAYFLGSYLSERYQEKEKYLKLALNYFEKIDNRDMCGIMKLELADIYKKYNLHFKYEKSFSEGIKILSHSHTPENQATYHKYLLSYYRSKREFRLALLHSDSLAFYTKKTAMLYKRRSIEIVKSRYQDKKNQAKILDLKEKLEQKKIKNNILILLVSIFSIFCIITFILFRTIRKKKRIITLKKHVLKKKNKKLNSLLEYNSILTKETNHRVRNNLMLLIGIIQIEINKSKNETIKVKLRDIEQRIYNISAIHKYIYNFDNYNSLSIDYILNDIITCMKKNIDPALAENIHLTTEKIGLHMSKSTSVVLLINELVNNSVKYALKSVNDYIKIKLEKKGSEIEFSVTDSGKGFNPDEDHLSKNTVGMFLIKILTKQLNGEVFYNHTDKEFTTLIKFNN